VPSMSKTPNAETIELLRSFDSPTIANAIEIFKVRNHTEGYASSQLQCRFPELPPMVGYAVTCIADSTTPEPAGPSHVIDLFDAVAAAPKPAVVVVQHKGPDRSKSCFVGDIVCTTLLKLGAVGFVTDGGVRDLAGIRLRAPGFQLFAGGLVVSHGALVYLEVGVPVTVCGLSIRPGDLLHGDESGLVLIPPEVVESLPEKARTVQTKESQFIDFLSGSPWSVDELKSRFTHR
jgi:4-hydroxy-4-methyl-2-oxoglutarate aldolase